ncbi:DNA primase [Enterococcus alcedinis]|uniref:DNA primase n=1 Tax=Enterococcus alcedinis TaxID=1274384 RepID=A0A917N513_9ENTE|nr:DNA primase [Enterococcus alcedinis]
MERSSNAANCKTIIHYLTVECDEKKPTKNRNLVIVNNGICNRSKQALEPFTLHYVFVNKVATNYVENANEPSFSDWHFSSWIKELSDDNASKERLLWQIFAIAINSNYISEVAVFFLSEEGRTGKSTFQDLLISLVGRQNTTNLKIREFEKDFKLASTYGSSLVVGDDNNSKDFNETSENFKSVITGETVLINPKGKEPFTTRLTPFVVQSMNGIARFKDVSYGLLRRLRVVRFNHSYKGEKNNRRIKEEYIHDRGLLEFILSKVINLQFDEVEDTAESQQIIGEIRRDNDAVYSFYEDVFPELQSERLPMKFIFDLFRAWSDSENNPTKMKQNTFTKEIKTIAEHNEWMYSRNNLAPLKFFAHIDKEFFDSLDQGYKYKGNVDTEKKQPLLWKDGNKATN